MTSLQHLSVSLDSAIGEIERQIVQFDDTDAGRERMNAFLDHALNCIEATVQLCTDRVDEKYCCVTLLTFEDNDQMLIRARSTNDRRCGVYIPQNETFAALAARYAKNGFVIHNFKCTKWFRKQTLVPFRSLTSPGEPPYRSILFLPLPLTTIDGDQVIKGVVTVDSAAPYEYLGKDMAIFIRVQSYLRLINVMLRNHAFGIQPEA